MDHKKSISLGLALSFVLSSTASALTPANELADELKAYRERNMVLEAQISQEESLQKLTDSDTVRVIVEVEGDSVIEKANQKNIRVAEMSESEVSKLQKNALKSQEKVQKSLDSDDINYEVINTFTNVSNGFSAETTLGEAKKMEGVDGVKSVTIANEYARPEEPDMNNSGEITETSSAWTNGYDGTGKVVAIVDTGIDSGHKDMVLTDGEKAALSKTDIDETVKDNNLSGKYYTEKVPYGYNYMDGNDEIRDLGPDASEHGMHVAGIVGANGDVENGGVKGTAPEVQLLAMKVFGNNPAMSSTFGDVIIKAIDDSVVLGADVINMSLGSSAGTIDDSDPEQAAVNRAVENGVLVSISSGNANVYGDGAMPYPYAKNPDYGVTGSPGVATNSLSVASIENTKTTGYAVEFSVDGENKAYPYTNSGTDVLDVLKGQALKVVDCGLGGTMDMFPAEVKGNVALVMRGTYNFTDKIANAEKAGAVAVIVYNSPSGGDALISMMYPDGGKIPALFTGYTAGSTMVEHSKDDGFTVSFNGNTKEADNPNAGEMSDFTSWGMTPSLVLKPEITGVGGNVWSTANDNGYQNMSGTSMAAPNVAGGSALVLERVEELLGVTGADRVKAAKNVLMSTAVPHPEESVYTSPRRQGAGVMNLAAATSTEAVVTDSATGVSKVELKEISGDKAVFELKVDNFGEKDITYDLAGTVQTDIEYKGYAITAPQMILTKGTDKMPISFSEDTVTVPAKGSKTVTVTVDLSNTELEYGGSFEEAFVNGGFVEGFVTLRDVKDSAPQLSIPYVGFKGDWDKVPAIDDSIYNYDESFYGETAMFGSTEKEGTYNYLGLYSRAEDLSEADAELVDFSPDGDNYLDSVVARVSFLRNVEEGEVEIVDPESGEVLTTLSKFSDYRKDYYDSGNGSYCKWLTDAKWDGSINGKPAAEGTYIYRVKVKAATFDGDTADWQNYDYKVNLDLTAPTITGVKFDEATSTLTVEAEDNLKGHEDVYLLLNPVTGKVVSNLVEGKFDISDVIKAGKSYTDCVVGVQDLAGNLATGKATTEPTGAAENDKTAPVVKVTSPEFFGILNSNDFTFEGTAADDSAIDYVTVDGEKVDLVYSEADGKWHFSHDMHLEDGYHSIYVDAKDVAGNELGFAHKIFVDATAPVITLDEVPSETTADSVKISGRASDNFPDINVKVNGNVVAHRSEDWAYFDTLKPADESFEFEAALEEGENTITVEAADGAGNVTTQTVVVNKIGKVETSVEKLFGSDRYATAVEISKAGWDSADCAVLASGTSYVDALVAAPLAAIKNAPVLLTQSNKLTDVTSSELDRLGVKTVFVVGGTGAITSDLEKDLALRGISVVRFAGSDRYDTSLRVARYIDRVNGNVTKAFVVGGMADADATSIASKAAVEKQPVLLVRKDAVPSDTLAWLKEKKLETAYVLGGTGVVSDSVLNSLNEVTTEDISGNRLWGADRYATNAAVVEALYGEYAEKVFVTKGLPVIDALVAAPYAAQFDAPIVLVRDSLSERQEEVLGGLTSPELVQVGGQVSAEVVTEMAELLSNK